MVAPMLAYNTCGDPPLLRAWFSWCMSGSLQLFTFVRYADGRMAGADGVAWLAQCFRPCRVADRPVGQVEL
jgi:hypothetical protein